VSVVLTPPPSKSDAQRALVLADLLGIPFDSVVTGDDLPRDVKVVRKGLEALRTAESWIDCRDGGAPFRFLLAQACVLPGRVVTFTGSARLGERPHGPLMDSLRAAVPGLTLEVGTPWPVVVRTPAQVAVRRFEVSGVESSQFASALLLAAARRVVADGQPVQVAVVGELASAGYLEMTRAWLQRAGFTVTDHEGAMQVGLGKPATHLEVPGDWSSLTYLLTMAWRSGAAIEHVDFSAEHPDKRFVQHLESVGLTVDRAPLVRVGGWPKAGFVVDASQCPDAVPTLAVLAPFLPAPSVFTNCRILKVKESDRLASIVDLLGSAGVSTTLDGETLTVTPGRVRRCEFNAHDDHRMAMSAALLGWLGGARIAIEGRSSVSKSFPGFWREAEKVGLR
jgi:3-phosphoshikimate 1-carboxyvinyltransferase